MAAVVKLSSPPTGEFWEIPVLFDDAHLLALDKPAGLLVSPDRAHPERPSLMPLLHRGIERGAGWAKELRLDYLMNTHRLDSDASGVILLAKDKASFQGLAAQFSTDDPRRTFAALARGVAESDTFESDAKLAPHPLQMGVVHVDERRGKISRTIFAVRERFDGHVLLECRPCPGRLHQISAHLKRLRLPLVGDEAYGGRLLFLSTLKPDYEAKPNQPERPLMGRPALHAEKVDCAHPETGEALSISAPWPKDFAASVKYLRRFAAQVQ